MGLLLVTHIIISYSLIQQSGKSLSSFFSYILFSADHSQYNITWLKAQSFVKNKVYIEQYESNKS